jgi:formylglycine-generating enzyme required for sulfatase activity
MVGQTVSHYRVLEELGGGAMGVVYKAQDTRLKRLVALKFLPLDLTRDAEARQRFVQEAEAASALDHPHVCTIHDIESTGDGRVFIAMAFYEGETLKKRIQRGPLSITEAAGIGRQIAQGLTAAHEAGIVHRDVKPANVMITSRGEAKIVDFGIAKLVGHGDLTGTGLSLGTVAYMAPEQFTGHVDARADLWALGVVLYEMLTGRRPFEAANEPAVMNAILNETPPGVGTLRPDAPPAIVTIVERALQKNPADRYASAAEMERDLAALETPTGPTAVDDTGAIWRALRRPRVAVPLAAAIAAVTYLLVSAFVEQDRVRWAREEAIPRIAELLQRDEYAAANTLAEQAERYAPADPVLAGLWPQITVTPSPTTTPAGARVSVRPYGSPPETEWRLLGTTPLSNVRLPHGTYRWRVEAEGFEPAEFARNAADMVPPASVELSPRGQTPPGMISIPATRRAVGLNGFEVEDAVAVGAFQIARHEVTNHQFKAFMDAGGYTRRDYWKHEFDQDGRRLSWDEGIALLHDSTGRPGPASWELGDYPAGQADYPVTGVSWYEAAAYAEFRGAHLPTIYHWSRAAHSFIFPAPISGLITAASNFGGTTAVAVGSTGALGPYGTYDMAGNVREWCSNLSGQNRWILGGAWNDPAYMYVMPYSLPPLDRSSINGFRLAQYMDAEGVENLSKPIEVFRRDFRTAAPVSDEVFEVFKRQFDSVPSPVNAKTEEIDTTSPNWTRERVSLDTGYGERLTAYLFVPRTGPTRRQVLVGVPVIGPFLRQASSGTAGPNGIQDALIKSGRILVQPVFKGSFERFDGFLALTGERYQQAFRQHMHHWHQELGQLVDYLAARPDVDGEKLGYYGSSFGAAAALPLLALEPRFKTAVLVNGGLTFRTLSPEIDLVNYAPRITIPVLLLSGRYDHLFPVESSQKPLLALLGTPADQKRHVLFDAGHGILPRGQSIHEALTWLDRYLGPVE